MNSANCSGEADHRLEHVRDDGALEERLVGEQRPHLGVDLADDFARRAGGGEQAEPGDGLVARHASRRWPAPRGAAAGAWRCRPPSILALPALYGGTDALRLTDVSMMCPAMHVVERRRRAAVMHRRELDAGHALQQRDVDVAGGADARGAVGDLAGLLLCERDQLGDVVGRQRRMRQQPLVDADEAGDRREVLRRRRAACRRAASD